MALPSLSVLSFLVLSLVFFCDGGCEVPVCWVRKNCFPVYHNHSSAIASTFSKMEVANDHALPASPKSKPWGFRCHIERLKKIQDSGSFFG
ncbi:hypothetical protein BDW42DRAFT_174973, partial [Aspergillus taichungensis]